MTGLIRQLKLHALMGDKALTDGRAVRIIEYFDELFNGMQMSVIPEYHKENIIFHKGDRFYMEQDLTNNWLECRWDGYWAYLENTFGLEYNETRAVVKIMVEKHLRQQVGTPHLRRGDISAVVELYLHHVGTHHLGKGDTSVLLDKHLHLVGKPFATILSAPRLVDEHIKKHDVI